MSEQTQQPLMRFDLGPLQTRSEVVAYVIATARAQGQDEIEAVNQLLKLAPMYREDAREIEQQLRQLAYINVADHLRARARRLPARPPPKWPQRPDLPDHSWRLHRDTSSSDSSN